MLFVQNQGSCVSNRVCVECEADMDSSDMDCASLNCSVSLIPQVQEEEDYFINGKFSSSIARGISDTHVCAGLPAVRCDFLDMNDCLRVYYISSTGSSLGPIHLEETAGQLLALS